MEEKRERARWSMAMPADWTRLSEVETGRRLLGAQAHTKCTDLAPSSSCSHRHAALTSIISGRAPIVPHPADCPAPRVSTRICSRPGPQLPSATKISAALRRPQSAEQRRGFG